MNRVWMVCVTIALIAAIICNFCSLIVYGDLNNRLDKLETIFENADYVTITENGSAEVN